MITTHEEFIVDGDGKRKAVLVGTGSFGRWFASVTAEKPIAEVGVVSHNGTVSS